MSSEIDVTISLLWNRKISFLTNFCGFWRISSLIRSMSMMSNFNHELSNLFYFHLQTRHLWFSVQVLESQTKLFGFFGQNFGTREWCFDFPSNTLIFLCHHYQNRVFWVYIIYHKWLFLNIFFYIGHNIVNISGNTVTERSE